MKLLKENSAPLWILERIKGQKRYVFLLIIANILFALTIIVFSLGCQRLIDSAVVADAANVKKYGIILCMIVLFRLLTRLFMGWLYEVLNAKLSNMMRQQTLEQLMKKEYYAVKHYHSGELVNRMFSDVKIVVGGILDIFPLLANMATRLIGAVIILIQLDGRFTFVFIGAGLATYLVTTMFRGKMKRLHKDVQAEEGKVHSFVQESIGSIRLIKSADMEKKVLDKNDNFQKDFYKSQIHRSFYTVTAGSGMSFVFQMGYLGALIWGGIKISVQAMSYGTLMAILQLVGQIQAPFSNLSGIFQRFYGMIASAERLQELYLLEDEVLYEEDLQTEKILNFEELRFTNLDFSFDNVSVLEQVDFTIKSGDFVAVTGLSGGGKSTMFLLMLGIYQPDKGTIYIQADNNVFRAGKRTRPLFAYVPQGNTLFSGTIRENIMMFSSDVSDDEIWNAAELACIKDVLMELPDGLDTVIGERGIGLSEGQAQRIAVARALLSGAPVLLLDEATSALDNETEKNMLKNIASLKDKTCIIVTHREEALSICNRFLHLEEGRLKEVEELHYERN